MAFTASTCLTDLGGTTLTDPIKFYSDVNNFLFEFGSANLSELTGSNCPYILQNIPDGTKVVKFVSENNYCATVDVEKLDCDYFNFQLITNNAVSRIITGNDSLKASNTILSDYSIAWYGPNNKNNLIFTSGKGSFSYDFTDPINQPVEGGTYYPVVQNVKFNGKTFSNTGGTGQIYADLEDCLEPQVIQPCNCENRTSQFGDKYNHTYTYKATSNDKPIPVTVSLVLTSDTKYVGWTFRGFNQPDRIKIFFEGSSYPMQIGLEDMIIGDFLPSSSFKNTDFPKSAKTDDFVSKIISLEKFTVKNNDKIIFNIFPSDKETSWDLSYTCLVDKFCQPCYFGQNNYKIPKSSITQTYDSVKCELKINYAVTNNCPSDNGFLDYNVSQDILFPYNIPQANSKIDYQTKLYINRGGCFLNYPVQNNKATPVCNGKSLTFTKGFDGTTATYTWVGDPSVINLYYNELMSAIQNYSGTTTTDNQQPDYYSYIYIHIPDIGSTLCPDSIPDTRRITIPVSSTITKSLDNKTLIIKPNILTYNPNVLNNVPTGLCSNCNELYFKDRIDNLLNPNTTQSSPLYTTTISNGYLDHVIWFFAQQKSAVLTYSSDTTFGYFQYTPALVDTVPFSGSNTLIPSLSASTCESIKCGNLFSNNVGTNFKYYYTTYILDPSDTTSYRITNRVVNCNLGSEFNIYIYSGGSAQYFDPNYII